MLTSFETKQNPGSKATIIQINYNPVQVKIN